MSQVINQIPTQPRDFDDDLERKKKISANLEYLNKCVGKKYHDYRFTNWIAKTDRQKTVKSFVEEWADTFPERKKNGEGLLLFGTVGTGKDHLLYAAARKIVIVHGASVNWVNGRSMFSELRDRIGEQKDEQSFIRRLVQKDVLVITDPLSVMGEPLTNYNADMFYQVIEERSVEGKPTCVALNVADDVDGKKRIGAPTWDRIVDHAWVAKTDWPTHRQPSRIA
jgi:DNA replication protein DnaC